MDYIKVINWKDFQHYKHRNPPWIKLHTSLLDNDEFDCLQDDSKLLLICLWLYNARKGDGNIQADCRKLQKKLPLSKKINLQPLVDAGFIECYRDDSKTQADSEQNADSEKSRVETEKSRVENMSSVEKVFSCWNKQKERGRWKTHREILPDIWVAVRSNVAAGWSANDMCLAIQNFARVVQGKDYKWTYTKWGLTQFLTRGVEDKDLRWLWFHPNNFIESEWLTDEAKRRQGVKTETEGERQQIRQEEGQYYREKTIKELEAMLKEPNRILRHWLIKEVILEKQKA